MEKMNSRLMVETELYIKYQSYAKAIELLEDVIERYPVISLPNKALKTSIGVPANLTEPTKLLGRLH
jgi:hypothetical protein